MSPTKANWIRYTELLKEKLPNFYAALMRPASDEEITIAENKFLENGISLPDELKDIYSVCGGDSSPSVEGCMGFSLHKFPTYGSLRDMEGDIVSVPKGYVKRMYASKHWIPFANDNIGGSLCIDLSPDENGKVGQIISFSSDDDNRIVFADSLADFIQFLIHKLEADEFIVKEEYDRVSLKFTADDFEEKDWDAVGGYNVAMTVFGEVDEENDLLGKRRS